jgi:hypothetical protein
VDVRQGRSRPFDAWDDWPKAGRFPRAKLAGGLRIPRATEEHDGHAVESQPRSQQECPFGTAGCALSKREAARALGVSVDFLEHHVLHELRIVRRAHQRPQLALECVGLTRERTNLGDELARDSQLAVTATRT